MNPGFKFLGALVLIVLGLEIWKWILIAADRISGGRVGRFLHAMTDGDGDEIL